MSPGLPQLVYGTGEADTATSNTAITASASFISFFLVFWIVTGAKTSIWSLRHILKLLLFWIFHKNSNLCLVFFFSCFVCVLKREKDAERIYTAKRHKLETEKHRKDTS